MKLRNIKDPSIAKNAYNNYEEITERVSIDRWIEYIEANSNYYVWLENTDDGKNRLLNIDKVPESFKDKILKLHNKRQALAEYNFKKGYYEIIIDYIEGYGKISTTFQKPITEVHLRRLLDMANYLNAYLLNNGNEIINEKILDSFRS